MKRDFVQSDFTVTVYDFSLLALTVLKIVNSTPHEVQYLS
jgi:hypothetical protein